jgi:hypothetical protein
MPRAPTPDAKDEGPSPLPVADNVVRGGLRAVLELHDLSTRAAHYAAQLKTATGRTLVLHFDVNGTILRLDSTSGHADEAAADSEIFSKLTFGTAAAADPAAPWTADARDPLRARKGTISYYNHLRATVPPADVKRLAAAFVQSDAGVPVRAMYDNMRAHSATELFTSFCLTTQAFPEAVVVFRTFGSDGDALVGLLASTGLCLSTHSCLRFAADPARGVMRCDATGREFAPSAFNNYLATLKGRFVLIQEDYGYWAGKGKDPACGKLLRGCPTLYQIGFDDLGRACWHVTGAKHASLVQANTYLACTDPAYYLRLIVDDMRARLGR